MRIISMEKGDNVKNIFTRFSNATAAIGEVMEIFCGKFVIIIRFYAEKTICDVFKIHT